MKNITIAGGITRDAVLRRTGDGKPVLGFSVGVDDGFGQNKRSMYFDCSIWGDRGEKLADFLTKGTKVAVSGDLSTREHEGKTYLTVRVNEVTLQGGSQRDGGGGQREDWQRTGAEGRGSQSGGYGGGGIEDDLDSIPF